MERKIGVLIFLIIFYGLILAHAQRHKRIATYNYNAGKVLINLLDTLISRSGDSFHIHQMIAYKNEKVVVVKAFGSLNDVDTNLILGDWLNQEWPLTQLPNKVNYSDTSNCYFPPYERKK